MARKSQKSEKKVQSVSPKTVTDPATALLPTMPLIDGEEEADFHAFRAKCLAASSPKDAIEEVWVVDFISYAWEANRLRRMKTAIIQSARRKAVEDIVFEYGEGSIFPEHQNLFDRRDTSQRIALTWSQGENDHVDYIASLLEAHGLSLDTVVAKAVSAKIEDLERIDKLIASYDYRRDSALKEMEKRRDQIARRLSQFTDANFEELEAAE